MSLYLPFSLSVSLSLYVSLYLSLHTSLFEIYVEDDNFAWLAGIWGPHLKRSERERERRGRNEERQKGERKKIWREFMIRIKRKMKERKKKKKKDKKENRERDIYFVHRRNCTQHTQKRNICISHPLTLGFNWIECIHFRPHFNTAPTCLSLSSFISFSLSLLFPLSPFGSKSDPFSDPPQWRVSPLPLDTSSIMWNACIKHYASNTMYQTLCSRCVPLLPVSNNCHPFFWKTYKLKTPAFFVKHESLIQFFPRYNFFNT